MSITMLRRLVGRVSKHQGLQYQVTAKINNWKSASPQKELPKEADVVVIGAGVIGCAVTYYLSKLDCGNIVLLDKHEVSSGTTWHSEALVWQLRPSDVDIQFLKCTMDLAKVLPDESDSEVGLVQNGGLFIASRKERLDEYKRLHTIGKLFGTESRVMSPSEVAQQYPQVNTNDMYGALFSPADGSLEPAAYCHALLKVAERSKKVSVVSNCASTKLITEKNQRGRSVLTGVETLRGTVRTKVAVLCAGLWSPYIVRHAGLQLPIFPFQHTFAVTNENEEFGKMPNIRDHDGSISTKVLGKSLCVAGYEVEPSEALETQLAIGANEKSSHLLSPVNWSTFAKIMQNAAHRVPMLNTVGIRHTVCGPEAFTPDHKPLLGETPELLGLFLGCGFNAAGIMYSAGSARELAHWIVHGRPRFDLLAYDCRRFNPALLSNASWLRERSHEAYATNYSVVYRNDAPLAGRNQKTDVLHDVLLQQGCVYQEKFGWERPAWFSDQGKQAAIRKYDFYGAYGHSKHRNYAYASLMKGEQTFDFPLSFPAIERECLASRNAASLANLSSRGKFFLVGKDAYRAADWLLSNAIPRQFGKVVQCLVLNKDAGVELDTTVCVVNQHEDPLSVSFDRSILTFSELGGHGDEDIEPYYYFLTVDCGMDCKFIDLVNRQLDSKGFDCNLLDASENMCTLFLQGPHTKEILGFDLSNLSHKVVVLGDGADRFKCRIVKFARFGESGLELHVSRRDGLKLYNYLKSHGAAHGLTNAGFRALDSLSVENSIQSIQNELRNCDTPYEAGLSSLCKLKDGKDFLGKAALVEQDPSNLQKRLVRLTLHKELMLHGLETIYMNGNRVGFVRRADFGQISAKSFAFGYVQSELAKGRLTDEFLLNGKYQIERIGELLDADVSLVTCSPLWSATRAD